MKVFDCTLEPNGAKLSCYVQDLSPEMPTADIRPAMLVFPGGGYYFCSDREAEPIALAYLAEGFNAFVLRYSAGADVPWERSYEDAQAALRYVRENARELHIDPDRIGVIGFSAGGHLASAMGTVAEDKVNAMILGYPCILKEVGRRLKKQIPGTNQFVSAETPPAFLFATSDDAVVPIRHSLRFAAAMAEKKRYFEMHIYPTGEHGFSLGRASEAGTNQAMVNPDAQAWFPASVRFLRHVFGDFPVRGERAACDFPER